MNRATAERLIRHLREVRVDRGATGPEADVAARKADQLAARFGLERHPPRPQPRQRRPRTAPPAGAEWVGGQFFGGGEPEPWDFDVRTGKASSNVKVHRYESARSWKIEVPL